MQFKELNIIPDILKALEREKYEVPTPIQEEAIPIILSGRDVLGCAQTGTGKTAAFAIPTLQLLSKKEVSHAQEQKIRALIITPTRELAMQIYESFRIYGRYTKLTSTVIFGGVSQKPQEEKLKQGVDILVATPGRLIDLMNQRQLDLQHIEMFILDEADRMLDMGFINDVKKIIAKIPVNKQTLLFSATMPPDIAKLSNDLLKNPARIEITPVSSTVEMIEQYLYYVDKINKRDLLRHILEDKSITSALVFSRTKHGADRIARQLSKEKVLAQAIHGDKSQGARQNALNDFKNRKLRVLVATDIAARGIDIDELSHVINYDLPEVPETYVHRIGRTGRAGQAGVAISFCDFDEKELLGNIEKLIGKQLIEMKEHPYPLVNNFPAEKKTQPRKVTKRVTPQYSDEPESSNIISVLSRKVYSYEDNNKTDTRRTDTRRTDTRRTDTRRTDTRQTDTRRTDTRRTDTRPTETRPTDTRRTETRPTETRPTDTRRTDTRRTDTRRTDTRPTDTRPTDTRPTDTRRTDSKQVDTKRSEDKRPYSRQTNPKQADSKPLAAPKKKYRMTADGSLKEKRSFNKFSKFGRKRDK
ncbi:MAG: box helicase domain protein [Herbinix sp.]|nr:box helicase domain protein [Herbinix sp.]